VWLRDTGPVFVRGANGLESVRFAWNGWGKKYEYLHDDSLAERLCAHYGKPSRSFLPIIEGGALELDGAGTCLTTESCLLNENRALDPDAPIEDRRTELEGVLAQAFGARKTIWLGGGLAGDHTDGHVDNVARFAAVGRVVHMRAQPKDDPNAEVLAAVERSLTTAKDARGKAFELCALPSPGRVLAAEGGEPMAASYCNFYLGSHVVVMPAFGVEADEPARRALAEVFPKHDVRMSSARTFLEGGGTFHCMTRQVPREPE
jgi:agmatine deiminase